MRSLQQPDGAGGPRQLTANQLTANNADWLETGDPKYIFTIPRAILPKPSLCDEITATKSLKQNRWFAVSLLRSVDLARGAGTFKDTKFLCFSK